MAATSSPNLAQLRGLIRFRFQLIHNRLGARGPLALVAVALGTGALLIGSGWVLSPNSFGPTRARSIVHWGGWALETAFYLTCAISVLQSFRIMEAFFRQDDARFLATLPTRLPALYFYRLGTALTETLGLSAGAAVFLLPVALKGGPEYYLAAVLLLGLATVLTVAIGFAAQMGAGVANYKALPGFFAELDKRSGGPGGGSAAYLFSPAIALATSMFMILICKMTLDEVFKANVGGAAFTLPGIAKFTAGLVAVTAVGCLTWAYRLFTRHYPLLFARFFETDLYRIDVGFDYFKRDRRPPRGFEARLRPAVRHIYRLNRLQLARRSPMTRLLNGAAAPTIVILFLTVGERIPAWSAAALIVGWALVVSCPWARLHHPAMDPGMGRVLPISRADSRRALILLLAREIGWVALPAAVAALLLPTWPQRLAALGAVAIIIAALPLLEALAGREHRAARGVGLALTALAAVGASLWPPSLFILAAVLALTAITTPPMGARK